LLYEVRHPTPYSEGSKKAPEAYFGKTEGTPEAGANIKNTKQTQDHSLVFQLAAAVALKTCFGDGQV